MVALVVTMTIKKKFTYR